MKKQPASSGLVECVGTWIESLPDAIRPAVFDALLIVGFAMVRGAWLVLPIAIIYVLVSDASPWQTIEYGCMVVGVAMASGALGGLAYGLVGRHLRGAFTGGRYLAGIVTATPYMFMVIYIRRLADHEPPFAPITQEDVAISGAMAVIFGLVIGHSWFGPNQQDSGLNL